MKTENASKTEKKNRAVPAIVHDWLSANGKKGGRKGRMTPPKNADGSPGQWDAPNDQKH